MLSESDVSNRWRNLLKDGDLSAQTIRQAQQLIDRLPLESPLRVRLGNELEAIRQLKKERRKVAG